jgi:hypothetical protein
MAVVQSGISTPTRTNTVTLGFSTIPIQPLSTESGTTPDVVLYGNLVSGQTVYTTGAPAGGATLSWLV